MLKFVEMANSSTHYRNMSGISIFKGMTLGKVFKLESWVIIFHAPAESVIAKFQN